MEVFNTPTRRQPSDESSPAHVAFPLPELSRMEHDDGGESGRESSGPDEAVFDNVVLAEDSSPGTSHHSEDEISLLPDSRRTSFFNTATHPAPFTPPQQRSPFRKPSSVRAIQLDTTPPYLVSSPHYEKHRIRNLSRNSTPRSTRSYHSGMRSARASPSKDHRKEYPLVLLHVTLLPITCPYSQVVMESVLPPHVIENWKLLHEKVTSTVLDRGILIPHPREDYDLLEERLLESLELKSPRILKCGHFHLTPEEEADIEASEDEYDSEGEFETCQDCGRRIRDGRFGAGVGQRRWSIKVYASNGLMKAGAWGAAWQEMERVDIEVLPWIDDEMKRELETQQEAQRLATHALQDSLSTMDEERRREVYGEIPTGIDENLRDENYVGRSTLNGQGQDLPLSVLISNYVQHLLQDRKNLAIVLLSFCVLHLALRLGSAPAAIANHPEQAIHTDSAFTSGLATPGLKDDTGKTKFTSNSVSVYTSAETPFVLSASESAVLNTFPSTDESGGPNGSEV